MISSTTNKQVKFVNALVKKAKTRREEDLFVAEGLRMCSEIPKDRIHTLYLSESFSKTKEGKALREGVKHIELVTDEVFKNLSDTQTPQGILALVKQYHYTLEEVAGGSRKSAQAEDLQEKPALLMVLETIQDPGNLGTILRAGEGAGVTGIVMDANTADIYNPKVIRSTMGSVLRMPFVYVENLHETLEELKKKKIRLFAAHLQGKHAYDQEDYTGPAAFLIGNEGNGLTEETAAMADTYIRIPMEGRVESLNAAVAASVLMFEAARQRRNHTGKSERGRCYGSNLLAYRFCSAGGDRDHDYSPDHDLVCGWRSHCLCGSPLRRSGSSTASGICCDLLPPAVSDPPAGYQVCQYFYGEDKCREPDRKRCRSNGRDRQHKRDRCRYGAGPGVDRTGRKRQ